MAEDSLRSMIDAIRSRLHEQLETQLAQISTRHTTEVESVRRAAGEDAEQRWSARVLGRHASVTLAHLTAARAADAMRRSSAEDGSSARRYARLLVSEIKLYNEAAVQIGRQERDQLARLKPEIERARKLYSQRISPTVDSRSALFQQELVLTLADGDASLLGNPA